MNKFTGIGNLGSNPQLRKTDSGISVTNFSIAIDRTYYQGEGSNRQTVKGTDWIPVVAWVGLAEICCKHLQKGSKICVEGVIRPRSYQNSRGTTHNTFEVIASAVHFLDKIRSNSEVMNQEESDTNTSEKLARFIANHRETSSPL